MMDYTWRGELQSNLVSVQLMERWIDTVAHEATNLDVHGQDPHSSDRSSNSSRVCGGTWV